VILNGGKLVQKINILDTTLRDGSYAINFSFTATDTKLICEKLEGVGLKYIEIGHGLGFNASNMGYGQAAESDEQYMISAKSVLRKAMFGMFCIPGIAKLENLELAKKHDMGFVRIGTDVTKIAQSEKFIKKSKENGMFVAANFMKSYVLEPKKFAKKVKLSEKYGADMVYIVDSAGGMFADNIIDYYKAIREVSSIPLGFHGHDNLGLAISNSLQAVDLGFEYIDSSLQGIGRSSGNASTEILVAALKKKGIETGIDFLKLLEVGWTYVQPFLDSKGKYPLDIVAGFAEFHSSYMPKILKCSAKYHVDPAALIIEICSIDKIEVNEKILEEIAKKMHKSITVFIAKYGLNRYVGREQDQRQN